MRLVHALRLLPSGNARPGSPPRLALVGAGGKTTALFRLARQLAEGRRAPAPAGAALVTATTHLSIEQLAEADRHLFIQSAGEVERLERESLEGIILLTGPTGDDGRTAGLEGAGLEAIHHLAVERSLPLLVEADGSRRRPLKAPAGHEPSLPAWSDTVIVVAGLSGLGRALNSEWVHRPERFSRLAGLDLEAEITPAALTLVLISPEGGLKAIPDGARRVALLNQADTPLRQAQARRIAETLLPAYDAVLVSHLLQDPLPEQVDGQPAPSESHLPAAGGAGEVLAVHEPVGGILLAAGGSQRLGRPKQLLEWRGIPLVRHAALAAMHGGLSPLVVVTGAYAGEVGTALAGLPVRFAHNPDWQAGQSSSLQAGLRELPAETGAAIFLLSDQPHVAAPLVRALVDLHSQTLSPLVAPQADGKRANPVLFDRQTFPDLQSLSGDMGGRALFSRFPVAWLPWNDPNIQMDVDTEEDYRRLLET